MAANDPSQMVVVLLPHADANQGQLYKFEKREENMTLSFLALPVIPKLKITDKGLVDVARFKTVPLFVD